jgi:hypothetical protein
VFKKDLSVNWLLRAKTHARLAVLAAGAIWLAHLAWKDTILLLRFQPVGIDFMPMWAAARQAFAHPERVYDFTRLTAIQHPLLANFHGLRPFVYPPSALMLFEPFSFAPFDLAAGLWVAAGLALVVWITGRQIPSDAERLVVLPALAIAPASMLVILTGQVTFLIAALSLAGLLTLKERPILAGALFGLAGALKPQALLLLPVAMFAIGQWRVLASAAVTAAATALASLVLFGPRLWLDWLAAVPRFETFVMTAPALARGMITPTAIGLWLGLEATQLASWRLAFALAGVAIAWRVFRRTEDPAHRLAALLGGALLVTPYAMHYDAALLAPAAALMLTGRSPPGAWFAALAGSALLCCAAIPHWGAVAVTTFVILAALTPELGLAAWPKLRAAGPPHPQRTPSGA